MDQNSKKIDVENSEDDSFDPINLLQGIQNQVKYDKNVLDDELQILNYFEAFENSLIVDSFYESIDANLRIASL